MHNYHTEDYYFHANGDPVPGEVLIKKVDWEGDTFRTTCEEIITFCAAMQLEALGPSVILRTTLFQVDGPNVTMRALATVDSDDALNITLPIASLQDFATQALQRRFEYYIEEMFSDSDASQVMAAIGLFANLTRRAPPCEEG